MKENKKLDIDPNKVKKISPKFIREEKSPKSSSKKKG